MLPYKLLIWAGLMAHLECSLSKFWLKTWPVTSIIAGTVKIKIMKSHSGKKTLLSLVILTIWLAHNNGAIYSQITPYFALNHIFLSANENKTVKQNNQSHHVDMTLTCFQNAILMHFWFRFLTNRLLHGSIYMVLTKILQCLFRLLNCAISKWK